MSLSREFTPAEKALILALSLLLVGLAYFYFVYRPIEEVIKNAHAERDALQIELVAVQARVAKLAKMREELDGMGEHVDRMESYNNSKAEIALLNNCLVDAEDYSITFTAVKRDGDQIRREFSLQFTTDSFATAKKILSSLTQSEYRCKLGDVRYSSSYNIEGIERVGVNVDAVFYETMVGGTPDAGLPEDASTASGK